MGVRSRAFCADLRGIPVKCSNRLGPRHWFRLLDRQIWRRLRHQHSEHPLRGTASGRPGAA